VTRQQLLIPEDGGELEFTCRARDQLMLVSLVRAVAVTLRPLRCPGRRTAAAACFEVCAPSLSVFAACRNGRLAGDFMLDLDWNENVVAGRAEPSDPHERRQTPARTTS
jgi:hypothetical protein